MRFTKMQGAGNDFIILNNLELQLPVDALPAIARRVCLRARSLGGNALMVVDAPERGGDFQMRFYNSDGTVAEMCGNGARCIARYAVEHGLAGEAMTIETVAGDVKAWRLEKRLYKILLNQPTCIRLDLPLQEGGRTWDASYVELGDPGLPHLAVPYPGLAGVDLDALRPLGAALRRHPSLPKGANVNFYDILEDGRVVERTFERGVEDFTLACGTGSGSVALALVLMGKVPGPRVALEVPGGTLWSDVVREGDAVQELFLIGDTNLIAEGELLDEDLSW